MPQKYKELLLKDLCARLLYGVKIEITWWVMGEGTSINTTLELDHIEQLLNDEDGVTEIKPYLRSMSSMTEEEKIELYKVTGFYYLSNNELLKDEWYSFKNSIEDNKLFFPYPIWLDDLQKVFDWLHAHYFDYHNLIPKGLAIEVTEENNPYKD